MKKGKKIASTMMASMLAISLGACADGEENAKTVNSTESSSSSGTSNSKSKKYSYSPKEVHKVGEPIYKNSKGSIILEGYKPSKGGNYIIYLKYTGDLTTGDQDDMHMKFILDDSNYFILDQQDRIQIMKSGNEEYHVYTTEEPILSRKIIRVDTLLNPIEDSDLFDNSAEDAITAKIDDSKKGKVTIPGVESLDEKTIPVGITKSTNESTVTVDDITVKYDDGDKVSVNGSIKYNKDLDYTMYFKYLEPLAQEADSDELGISNPEGPFYEGTETNFYQDFEISTSLGKGNELIFSIDDNLFAIDLATGKELKQVDITKYPQYEADQNLIKGESANGFKDVAGKRVYDAILLEKPFSYFSTGEDYHTELFYGVNGYDKLKFDVGTEELGKDVPTSYDFYVYGGAGFHNEGGLEKPKGKILYHKKLSKGTPMESVDVNISGQDYVYLYIDNNIPSGGETDVKENYLPVILSNMKLSK